jgi:hypothetical protein
LNIYSTKNRKKHNKKIKKIEDRLVVIEQFRLMRGDDMEDDDEEFEMDEQDEYGDEME